MAGELRVEEIFRLRQRGTILWGTVVGVLRAGDRLVLQRADGTAAIGTLVAVEPHRPRDAPKEDQCGILVDADLGALVTVGDVLTKQGAR